MLIYRLVLCVRVCFLDRYKRISYTYNKHSACCGYDCDLPCLSLSNNLEYAIPFPRYGFNQTTRGGEGWNS